MCRRLLQSPRIRRLSGVTSVVVTGLILWLTLAPHPVGDIDIPLFPGADKVVHAAMFGGLTLALAFDVALGRGRLPSVAVVGRLAVISFLFGGLIEILQSVMGEGRQGDLLDFAADIAGALIVWAFYKIRFGQ